MAGKDNWRIIGLGYSGWHAAAPNVSSSSYDRREVQLNNYAAEAIEGAFVYDASKAEDLTSFTMSGPMCDAGLEPGETNCLSKETLDRAVSMCGPGGLSGGFDTMALYAAAQDKTGNKKYLFGSLDSVAPDIYINLLRQFCPGTRFGRVQNGKVVWE